MLTMRSRPEVIKGALARDETLVSRRRSGFMLPLQLCAIDDEPGQVGCEKGVPLDAECEFSQLTPAHEELQLSIRNAENPCRVVAVVAGSGEHGPQQV